MTLCKQCGNKFAPKTARQHHCSQPCWYKTRYAANKTSIRASQKQYYQANRKQLIAKSGAWRAAYSVTRPWAALLGTAKYRAKKEGLSFDLTYEWAKARWTGKCEVTGIPFVLNKSRSPYSPTTDKIRPSLGYTKDNCRFILFAVNALKYTGTDDEMFAMAEAIVKNKKKRI